MHPLLHNLSQRSKASTPDRPGKGLNPSGCGTFRMCTLWGSIPRHNCRKLHTLAALYVLSSAGAGLTRVCAPCAGCGYAREVTSKKSTA
eukprot:363540-Chlamydomonas_euryale.AAC.2